MTKKEVVEKDPSNETVRKPVKKYKRRAVLKYLGKVATGAALWGVGGHLAGKVFSYTVKPVVDTVLGTSERVGKAYEGLRRLNPFYKPIPIPKTTRRGFLSSLVRTAYRHPVAAGTIAGVTYGGGKYALGGMSKYLTERQMAILKDETANYKERLEVLEKYKAGVEKDLNGKDARINYLEGELTQVNKIIRGIKPGKLEKVTIEEGIPAEATEMLLALGVTGLLITFTLSSMTITGSTILESQPSRVFSAIIAIFIISLGLILFGAENTKKKADKTGRFLI